MNNTAAPDGRPATDPGQPLTDDDLSGILRRDYGLAVESVTLLGGEWDQTAAADLSEGHRVVVKVSPVGAQVDQIRWQQELMKMAGQALQPGLVPAVYRTSTGAERAIVDHAGQSRIVQVQSWLSGVPLAELNHHSPQLLRELGTTAAHLVRAFDGIDLPPTVATTHHWDLLRSPQAIVEGLALVAEPDQLRAVERIVAWFHDIVDPRSADLPRAVVHQDLNDFNVLAAADRDGCHHISGVLDYADALFSARVSELAIAVAYAMLRKADPLIAATQVVQGFDSVIALNDDELAVIYPMAAARLCVNAVTWNARRTQPDAGYGSQRMRHTWPAILKLAQIAPDVAEAALRAAVPEREGGSHRPAFRVPSCQINPLATATAEVRDLSISELLPGESPAMPGPGLAIAGQHLTSRANALRRRTTQAGEATTVHLGVDVYCAEPTTVLAPLPGLVEASGEPDGDPDGARHGGDVILRHVDADGRAFWSRWTGLTSRPLRPGDLVVAGAELGVAPAGDVSAAAASLGLSVFLSRDAACLAGGPFVGSASAAGWRAASPDPSPLLGLTAAEPDPRAMAESIVAVRETHFGRSQRSYYQAPMNLVAGRGAWLYDDAGRGYLDAINNVTHVGHGNPRVSSAVARQTRRLNTNSRFVYRGIADYAERLADLLPAPLEVIFLVCTGSEANDLALRIARQVTQRDDVMVIDHAYHGNTSAVTNISPIRYKGPGGSGVAPRTTHEVLQPNQYRGRFRYDDPAAGAKYAADVASVAAQLVEEGTPPAAFIAESAMGTAGCIFFPEGYLNASYEHVRAAGGLCICDEVQVGFGRMGDAFWGFEMHGVVPDIVTMGKPIANGYPMAAVATTREIADGFDTGMKYFNTFGGNPVACAAGMAVLDEIEEHQLQRRAHETGAYFLSRLQGLKNRHQLIGDVRGHGMYLGVELVRDRDTLEPATREAYQVSELMKEEGVLVYPTGPSDNILKIKPPLVFDEDDVDTFTAVLDGALALDW